MASSALPRDAAENSQSLWLFQSRKPRARIWGLVDSCCWDKRGLEAASPGLGRCGTSLPPPLLLLLLLLGHGDGEPLPPEEAKDS